MKLRSYQIEGIEDLKKGFSHYQRQVLCAPTGSGKTVVFSEIVKQAHDKGSQTLVLTDRVELFKQTCKTLSMEVQELNAKMKAKDFKRDALVTVGMVETIKRRDLIDYYPKLIIIDEAHKGNFNKVIEKYEKSYVIGATATPVGKHFHKYYQSIVETIDIMELISLGFLSPVRAYQMEDDFSDIKTKAGEYTDDSLFNHFNNRKLYKGVVDKWEEMTKGKKTIVFNVNIEHSEIMNNEFNDRGVSSRCLTSKTSQKEREEILKGFKNGEFLVLNNCGILTTGYDEPSIEVVIMNRKTKSLPLWLQCCGRGSRIYPNKEYFTILDFGMNHDEHGLWQEPREWTLSKPKKTKKQAAPVKTCKKCEALNYASAKVCAVCGEEFPKTEIKQTDGVMIEQILKVPENLTGRKVSSLSIEELILLQKSKKYKASFIWRVVRNRGSVWIKDYASKMGYSKGWVYRQELDINNSNFKDYRL